MRIPNNSNSDLMSSKPSAEVSLTDRVLSEVKLSLKDKVFSGHFTERRLIETGSVSMYKDVVLVDKSEREFVKALKIANDKLKKYFSGKIFTGISVDQNAYGTANSYSIYTNISGVALGDHWFQVKNVSLNQNIIVISLKSLRPLKTAGGVSSDSMSLNWDFTRINSDTFKKLIAKCTEVVTVENIVSLSRFLAVLFITFLIGCYHLLELLLRGVRELNIFLHNMTPVLIACVDGVTKMFGGLLILIAMMWNGSNRKYNQRPLIFNADGPHNPMIMGNTMQQQPPNLRYRSKF